MHSGNVINLAEYKAKNRKKQPRYWRDGPTIATIIKLESERARLGESERR